MINWWMVLLIVGWGGAYLAGASLERILRRRRDRWEQAKDRLKGYHYDA